MSTNKCAFGPCQILVFLLIKDPIPGIMKTSKHRKTDGKSDNEHQCRFLNHICVFLRFMVPMNSTQHNSRSNGACWFYINDISRERPQSVKKNQILSQYFTFSFRKEEKNVAFLFFNLLLSLMVLKLSVWLLVRNILSGIA